MQSQQQLSHPLGFRYLWFLTLTYAMVIVFANWFDARLVNIFGLVTDAGTIIFPLTFLLSDLITEVYGYKHARRAIWVGFLFNIIFLLYGLLVINLPSPSYPTHNDLFAIILSINSRIILASVLSYFTSEPLNALVLSKLKMKTQGRYMSLRFVLSTVVASGVDSFIFGSLAFYHTMSNYHLLMLIVVMWLIKVMIEIIGLPVSIALACKIKNIEKVDIYDYDTNFTLLSLENTYKIQQNLYEK